MEDGMREVKMHFRQDQVSGDEPTLILQSKFHLLMRL